ncbi:MBL fold metallo-hydrolase [bacterium]|nr:MBL fold metallo-hydrolase [bacterium]
MFIKVWGCRGSVPVSGKDYNKYGGDTTCIEIRTPNDKAIIIDAGNGIRRLGAELLESGIHEFDLFFTHLHWDHILGFPFFRPIYCDKCAVNIYKTHFMQTSVEESLQSIMVNPNFPITLDEAAGQITYKTIEKSGIEIDGVSLEPIPLSHPNGGAGFLITYKDYRIAFLTDNELGMTHPGGLTLDQCAERIKGVDLLLHDTEYKDDEYSKVKGWGHSTISQSIELAIKADVKGIGFLHHNQDRIDDAVDLMVEEARELINKSGKTIKVFAVYQDMFLSFSGDGLPRII